MRGSFFEFNVARSGLYTSKAGINVVGHNLANVSTPGFSRQVLNQSAANPIALRTGKGMVGTGSMVQGIGQVRSTIMDKSYWNSNGIYGKYGAKSSQLSVVQAILNDSDEVGISSQVNNFFAALNTAAQAAGSTTGRVNTVTQAQALCDYFNDTYASLQQQQRDLNDEIQLMTERINTIGRQIQALNKQIYYSEVDGSSANDLRDQRALLVDELSQYVNVEVVEKNIGGSDSYNLQYHVSINGYDFVSHFDVKQLECRSRDEAANSFDVPGLYDVYFKGSSVQLNNVNSMGTLKGELAGLLETRDGNNSVNFTGSVASVGINSVNGVNMYQVTISNASRYFDMNESDYIYLDGVKYHYSDFDYDAVTDTVTISVPPSHGLLDNGTDQIDYNITNTTAGVLTVDVGAIGSLVVGDVITVNGMTIGTVTTIVGNTLTIDTTTPAGTVESGILALAAGDPVSQGVPVNSKGIPYFMNMMNVFVRTLARAFNDGENMMGEAISGLSGGHRDAYNMLTPPNNTGWSFFTYMTNTVSKETFAGDQNFNYNSITAGNFSVAGELLSDPDYLAAALSVNPDLDDNRWLGEIYTILYNREVFGNGDINDYLETIIGQLSIEVQSTKTYEKNYAQVVVTADNRRLSFSSVEESEEYAKMFSYQKTFQACSQLINILDEIYAKTINLGIT